MTVERITIFVLGDQRRGDDGVADAIADTLQLEPRPEVDISRCGYLAPDALIECDRPIVVIDAVAGPAAGDLIDVPLAALVDEQHSWRPASSHAIPLEMTLAIAAHLSGRMPRGRFIGVAGASFGLGEELSVRVRAAIPVAAARIQAWIEAMTRQPRAATCV